MKKVLFILAALAVISCNDREDSSCNCYSQRYERTVVKEISSQNTVSTSEWIAKGSASPTSSDCATNGSIYSSGSENSHPIGGGQYVITEYKYQINCK